ncbi:MAG TPA: hypothetical protein VJQ09_05660, partial [Candidatus Limnocylindria bacterium]|nr:hypothetical protein [Candidatus Limnocylindria bacterium]
MSLARLPGVVVSALLSLLVLVIVAAGGAAFGLDGQTILYASVWTTALLVTAAGAFLALRGRPLAGLGALVC